MLDRLVRLFSGIFGGGTRDEIKPLNVSIEVGTADPAGADPIPIEVTVQGAELPGDVDFGADATVGLAGAFDTDGDRARVAEGFRAGVATPSSVMDFENPHQHGKLMHVSPSDLVLPLVPGEVTLGVGLFPEGPAGPSEHWGTDTVALSVEEPGEMQVRRRSGSRDRRRSVEVSHPSPFDPSDVRLGPRPAFDHVSDEHGREVRVAEWAADEIARPIGSVAVAGHENHWLLEFPGEATGGPDPDASGELVVGIFQGGEGAIPTDDWAIARVADAPDLDATG